MKQLSKKKFLTVFLLFFIIITILVLLYTDIFKKDFYTPSFVEKKDVEVVQTSSLYSPIFVPTKDCDCSRSVYPSEIYVNGCKTEQTFLDFNTSNFDQEIINIHVLDPENNVAIIYNDILSTCMNFNGDMLKYYPINTVFKFKFYDMYGTEFIVPEYRHDIILKDIPDKKLIK